MKLRYEAKVQIYELRKQGISLKRLSEKYGIKLTFGFFVLSFLGVVLFSFYIFSILKEIKELKQIKVK